MGMDWFMQVCILDVQADKRVVSLYPGQEEPVCGHQEGRWTCQVALVEGGQIVAHSVSAGLVGSGGLSFSSVLVTKGGGVPDM